MRINVGAFDEENGESAARSENKFFGRPPREKRKKWGCQKTGGCLFLAAVIIIVVIYATIRFAIGPVVKNIDALPADFPSDFAWYQIENAKIKIQNPESRDKIMKALQATPNWLIKPIWGYLSDNVKNQLAENFNQNALPQNFSVDDFKKLLASNQLGNAQNISLSWQNLDKTKEELLSYYKQELAKMGYEYKENLGDQQIDLGFWKKNIFGQMSFSDEQNTSSKSVMEMIINYVK